MAKAYTQLSTARSFGFNGVGPIPIWVIWSWCDRTGISEDQVVASFFVDVILEVDAKTLQAVRNRLGAKT